MYIEEVIKSILQAESHMDNGATLPNLGNDALKKYRGNNAQHDIGANEIM
jgi:hypothetical protein